MIIIIQREGEEKHVPVKYAAKNNLPLTYNCIFVLYMYFLQNQDHSLYICSAAYLKKANYNCLRNLKTTTDLMNN